MPARDFLANITVILLVMAIGAMVGTLAPMFAAGASARDRRTANLGLTALTFLLNIGVVVLDLRSSIRQYTPVEHAAAVTHGLDHADPAKLASVPGLLAMPFQKPERPAVPDTKVRIPARVDR